MSKLDPDYNTSDIDEEAHDNKWHKLRRWATLNKLALTVAGLATAGVGAVLFMVVQSSRPSRQQRKRKSVAREVVGDVGSEEEGTVRIPLRAVIRFKERQWFAEELQASREGDPNSMLRLARMYLHGQGCDKSIIMAQEWVRKARHMGLYTTLDELWGGTTAELEREQQAAMAGAQHQRQRRLQERPPNLSTQGRVARAG